MATSQPTAQTAAQPTAPPVAQPAALNLQIENQLVLGTNVAVIRVPIGGAPTVAPAAKLARPGVVIVSCSRFEDSENLGLEIVRPDAVDLAQAIAKIRLRVHATDAPRVSLLNFSRQGFWPDGTEDAGHGSDDRKDGGDDRKDGGDGGTDDIPMGDPILGFGYERDSLCVACTSARTVRVNPAIQLRVKLDELPGRYAPPADPPPLFPTRYYFQGQDGRVGQRVYPARAPRELWLELENLDAGGTVRARDVALLTVAPFLFRCELAPPKRLYAVFIPDDLYEVQPDEDDGHDSKRAPEKACKPGNFGFMVELCALAEDQGVPVHLWSTDTRPPRDVWAQDSHWFGYTVGPTEQRHYVTVAPRKQERGGFWEYDVGGEPGSEFNALFKPGAEDNSLDYGGNIVVSPPIAAATDAMDAGTAGPRVPAHPAAPYGKIIICDSGEHAARKRRPSPQTLAFLKAQKVQPVVPIDVSALQVGHADEVVSFVPSATGKGFKMLFASPDLASALIRELCNALDELGDDHVRRWHRMPNGFSPCGPRFGAKRADMLGHYKITKERGWLEPMPATAAFAAKLRAARLRLKAGLSLVDDDILDVPVTFDGVDRDVTTVSPNVVNLQLLGNVAIIPKPWGPRVTLAAARRALRGFSGSPDVRVVRDFYFGDLQREVVWLGPLQDLRPLRGVDLEHSEILERPKAVALPKGFADVDKMKEAEAAAGNWRRCVLQWSDSVCLFEAYLTLRLRPLGIVPVFLDDWQAYHVEHGDIHCGTNVARAIPAVAAEAAWWKNYDGYLAVDEDW